MKNENDIYVCGFPIVKFHPLTEIPKRPVTPPVKTVNDIKIADVNTTPVQEALHSILSGTSEVLKKLLWDILCYPFSSVSVRMKRLGISGRAFENAVLEGCEKKFFFRSSAGSTVNLIPEKKCFIASNMDDPFDSGGLREHSYYEHCCAFLNKKNPSYKTVQIKVKIGNSGAVADGVTIRHDGTREAWEVTLNTTNILANACKYEKTDFSKIIFLCRNYQLREAVKACCREGGLNSDLLAKLEYIQFSTLLQRQRKLYRY